MPCAICQEEFDISDKLIVDCCNKEICRECLQRYIAGKFESRRFPVRCLFSPECGDQFSESTLNLIATDEQLELLQEWSRRPTLGSHQCPAPNCTGYSLQDDGADVRCQCLLCHHQWCSGEGCEQADLVSSQHAGITCEAYTQWRRGNVEGDARFEVFVATQLADQKGADWIRKCPPAVWLRTIEGQDVQPRCVLAMPLPLVFQVCRLPCGIQSPVELPRSVGCNDGPRRAQVHHIIRAEAPRDSKVRLAHMSDDS